MLKCYGSKIPFLKLTHRNYSLLRRKMQRNIKKGGFPFVFLLIQLLFLLQNVTHSWSKNEQYKLHGHAMQCYSLTNNGPYKLEINVFMEYNLYDCYLYK